MAAFCVEAQTIICKDTLIEKRDTSIIYERDTTSIITSVLDHYDTTWIVKCGRWCKAGVTATRVKIDKITAVYRNDTAYIYDSTPITLINITNIKDTVCTIVAEPIKTKWGIKIQQDKFQNQLTVAKELGVTAIRPNSISVKNFTGDLGNVVEWKQNGLFTVLNVNWIDDPNQKPYDFVSGDDTVLFKTNFEKICKAAVGIVDIIVMENEPTNLGYYNWVSNTKTEYIHELQMAIPIAHKYGLKIADGCVFYQLVEMVRNGTWQNDDKAIRNKTLMDAYKTLDLDYVNTHTSYGKNPRKPTGYPVDDLPTTIEYLRNYTGHQIICNEYSMVGADNTVVKWFVDGFKNGEVHVVLPWSGDPQNQIHTIQALL